MPLDPRHRLYRDLEDESVTPEVFAARHRAWLASLAPPPPEETTPPDATTARSNEPTRVGAGSAARVAANLRALRALRAVQASGGSPSATQLSALRGWCGWGAAAGLFDTTQPSFADARAELVGLVSPAEYRAAERTTLTAHYTDPAIAEVMWETLSGLGFTGGPVLEPGCGAGVFLGTAPAGAAMVGVELDPVTAAIAGLLASDGEGADRVVR